MPRTRDAVRVEQARALAAGGMTQAQVSAELGIPIRTLRSWGIDWAHSRGRPRLPDGVGSRWTQRRRQEEAATGLPLPDARLGRDT